MLVLSRKLNESIIISDNIRVTIVEIEGSKVRLGITAPPEVRVDREEVARRIREFVEPQVVGVSSP
jgi:carbon storage regulator